MTVIVDATLANAEELAAHVEPAATPLAGIDALRRHLDQHPDEDVAVLGPNLDADTALGLAEDMRISRPSFGVVLVRRQVDATLLTEALRAGVREVVPERELHDVPSSIRRAREVATAIRARAGGPDHASASASEGVLAVVFSAKGGCGKTTISTNLAAALADNGRREVCIVDLDLAFGDVAIALQLFPSHTLADAVPLGGAIDDTAVAALLTPHSPGLTALVAPVEPGSAENIPAQTVAQVLSVLKKRFQFVVVDTPPAFTDHVLAAVDQADVLALIATLDVPALKNLKLTLETLDLLNYNRDLWRVVLNRADSKVGLSVADVEKTLRMPITAQIPSSRAVPASINRGVPIVIDEPSHSVSLAIKSFADTQILPLASTHGHIPPEMRTDRRRMFARKAKSS
jgi:pilus assembly protein CpaE